MPVVSPISLQRVDLPPSVPGLIERIEPDSFAAQIGLLAGDRVTTVNGKTLMDALDFQFHAQAETVRIEILRDDRRRRFDVQMAGDEFWGITFADPTFDGIRTCENACPFCFIKQIPKGMRRSLYVMDDDYRYSMLYGSFVTLTNLSDKDWARIEEQRVSPMHVSVHATNPELRVALVGNPKGALIMEDLDRLRRNNIDFHAQLGLNPGRQRRRGDGPQHPRTRRARTTASRSPAVPVGSDPTRSRAPEQAGAPLADLHAPPARQADRGPPLRTGRGQGGHSSGRAMAGALPRDAGRDLPPSR